MNLLQDSTVCINTMSNVLYSEAATSTTQSLRQRHTFHILDSSPFPFLVSFFLLTLLAPTTLYMHGVELPVGLSRADIMHASFLGLYTTAMS